MDAETWQWERCGRNASQFKPNGARRATLRVCYPSCSYIYVAVDMHVDVDAYVDVGVHVHMYVRLCLFMYVRMYSHTCM